jgi:long-chain acyl-CoA synthetase
MNERPWLRQYPDWLPHELQTEHASAIDMLAATARRNPSAPAIHYFDRTLSFQEVDELSSGFAAALLARGFQRGDRIGIYLQNVPQFAVAVAGAWKAGGIVVPLNPMLKERELRYYLTDAGARFIVCLESLYPEVAAARADSPLEHVITTSELDLLDSSTVPDLLAGSTRVACADATDLFTFIEEGRGSTVADPRLGPDDVAILTYTSGTTGPSKGAMNSHRNVVFSSTVYQTWMRLGDDDVIAGLAPLFHITGLISHLTVSMLAGIPLVLFYRFDPAEALRAIERWKATFTVASITAFIALLENVEIRQRDLRSLTKAYSGGAPVSAATVERFREATGLYIHNIYGLTETTSPSHATPLGEEAPVDPDSGALAVGVPVCSTLCRIVDSESKRELSAGEIGELSTHGPQVVPGYWHKPEESAHALRDGWLYTGDVGRMDENGWFYVVDRTKDMIIASGFKVWPREVEDVLYQHPSVREAAVVGVPDAYRGETVKAFVSLRSGADGSVTPDELIAFCRARMAAYKYPRAVEIVDEVPKTLTGKVLRRELRQREQEGIAHATPER